MPTARYPFLLLAAALLFCLAATVTALPTLASMAPPLNPNVPDPEPELSTEPQVMPRSLVKRHDWYLMCSTDPQDPDRKAAFKGNEDIPLSRRCLAAPYKYSCDADGYIDYHRTLGEQDIECSTLCKCLKPANPKPLCLKLGSSDDSKNCAN